MKILIADDDPVSRRLLEATLNQLGHEVVAVEHGLAAIDILLAADGPRLAILDWMMPECDGLEVCRRIRQRSSPYVYLILLTARDRRSDMLTAFDAGVDDFLTKPCDSVELHLRLRSGERVITLQEHLLETQAALKFEAAHDRLTGLWNRGTTFDHLQRELSRARRKKSGLAVLLADIDHFKQINDKHGHAVGDAVLRDVSMRMRATLRAYDAIGRYGGEEFLIVLPGCDVQGAHDVGNRMRRAVSAESIDDSNASVWASISLGAAATATDGYEADALIRAADAALYRAKALGRDRVAG